MTSKLLYSVSISLDGYVAGPSQSRDHPLGVGGERLHEWMRTLAAWRSNAGQAGGVENENTAVHERDENVGALVMGRGMFCGGPGQWDPEWIGWWGTNPPFHLPVFVLTHHERAPLNLEGDNDFTFVTDSAEAALAQAKAAAGDRNVKVIGGAFTVAQFFREGLIDEFLLHLVPITLGGGARLFADPFRADLRYKNEWVVVGPGVTHLYFARED
jgi:dihydrofolate reductase